jgi:type II secretory pathway pseudopilin PulG
MSLIEVMVALLILGLMTVPLVNFFLTGSVFTAVARHDVTALNFAQEVLEAVKGVPDNCLGTVRAATSTTVTLETRAGGTDYTGFMIATTGGPGAGQVRKVESYDHNARRATVDQAWDTVPTPGRTTYLLFRAGETRYRYAVTVAPDAQDPNLRTVTVTVYYWDRGVEREVSLTSERLRR